MKISAILPSQSPLKKATSITKRLMLGVTLAVSFFWLLAMMGAGILIRHEIGEAFDSALKEVVHRVLPLAYSDILTRDSDDSIAQTLPQVKSSGDYITYIVRDEKNAILLQSHDAIAEDFPADLQIGFETRGEKRFYTDKAIKNTLSVTAMERPGHRQATVRKMLMVLAVPLFLLLFAVVGMVYWIVKRSMHAVSAFGAAIALRGENNLEPISEQALPQEITSIGRAVNALLLRLSRALEAERSFTANSAHEMRTPLAGALARTQAVLARLEGAEAQTQLRDVEIALFRLSRLTEKLLQLAKADGGLLRSNEKQDLCAIIPHILADFSERVRIQLKMPDHPIYATIDIDIFAIALRNLTENALKYGAKDSPIEVLFTAEGALIVTNQGPNLSQEAFMRLCQRFERGQSGEEGAGLGLAIVSAIARGLKGEFHLVSPLPQQMGGVAMHLALPLEHPFQA